MSTKDFEEYLSLIERAQKCKYDRGKLNLDRGRRNSRSVGPEFRKYVVAVAKTSRVRALGMILEVMHAYPPSQVEPAVHVDNERVLRCKALTSF